MTKILLIEDDGSMGATLRDRLLKEGYEVVWTRTVKGAKEAVESSSFDLYLFDVGLPDGDGFTLARSLPAKPFIFLTAQADAESRLKGYELGAEEFVPKPFHLRELLLRIRHVLDNHVPAQSLDLGEVQVRFDSFEFMRRGQKEPIPARDILFLQLLVQRSPNAVTRDEALSCLRGDDKFPSNRTVDNVVLRLRSALGEHGHCIESVRGIGYRWIRKD